MLPKDRVRECINLMEKELKAGLTRLPLLPPPPFSPSPPPIPPLSNYYPLQPARALCGFFPTLPSPLRSAIFLLPTPRA